ncbi:bifunctional chorismate-binding protein/class IV aminotransferase [Campylobacter sp. US33a]|uniref:bifunctional chorismate-binding protein/class IV aminotransferase n=1 Tax=Campylobacter sp. US33a TaxID=2498120 RepID=UPI0010685AF2|nr:bifunctional anthranilate synthase component I family protein/aminotransferase class IV [Campylobacter sp. US33a]TEY01593.1 bifunctional aminodeoxychorismate synthase component I/aminotransferase [Campylobacter sp. US33a]
MRNFAIFDNQIYYDLKCILKAKNQKESKKCFKILQKYKHKFFFICVIDYEFYEYLEDKNYKSKEEYLKFFVYRKRKPFKPLEIDDESFLPSFKSNLDFKEYEKNFALVKEAIAKGQSYQINLTQSFDFESKLDSFSLFNLLSKRQNTEFKAYIKDEKKEILSFSPELFFKTSKRNIITKPMKGTVKRDENPKKDEENKLFLKNDSKNLSENVMIADLLRNDLSKLIKKESMKTRLFKIQSHPTLHQMTSTIKGKLKKNTTYYKIFKALFPSGSITGTPKIESIKLIKDLEKRQRGIYCGAIGLVHKKKSKFSVAIRTIEKEKVYKYSVGSGLVWDSKLNEEFEELKLKASFLMPKDFYLFETMYYKNGFILFFKEHLQRLLNSAFKLGFNTEKLNHKFESILNKNTNFDEFKNLSLEKLNQKLFDEKHSLFYKFKLNAPKKALIKIILEKSGDFKISTTSLTEQTSDLLLLSDEKLNSCSDFLYHKTSLRKIYDEKSFLWKENQCFDIAFFNQKDELCEGSRSNIIIKKDDIFYTPTLQSGLLNGIYRQFLLDLNLVKEKTLFKEDLINADEIYCINSVRGLKKVKLK